MHHSTLEECVVKVAEENREEHFSQDNLRLERTRCNTPKYLWDIKKSDVSSMPWETEKPPLAKVDEKPTDGTSTSKKESRRTWNDAVWECLRSSVRTLTEPRQRIEDFCCQDDYGVMNVHLFARRFFPTFFQFRTHVLATTVCTTERCAHTHLSHAHFSAHSAVTAYFAHLHACHTHALLKCLEKVHCTSVVSLHLAFSLLMIHPSSLLFLDGHFKTTPDYDFDDDPIHKILPYFPVLEP